MPKNFLDIINSYADFTQSSRMTWDQLIQVYPSLEGTTKPTEGKTKVISSVHCECTIAIHMGGKLWKHEGPGPKFVEIGVSKLSCWLCEKYMEFLMQSSGFNGLKLVVTGYQDKIHAGWMPPPNGPINALCSIANLVRGELDEVSANVERELRSDSFPRVSSGDDEEQSIGVESQGMWDESSI